MKKSIHDLWRIGVCLAIAQLACRGWPARAEDAPPPLPEGDHGIAARYPGDEGIEGDPRVLFHDDFESGNLGKWDNYWQKVDTRVADEPENVHAGKRALEFTVPKRETELSNGAMKELRIGQDVVFLRYYTKFDKGFDQTGSSHNGALILARAPGLPYSTPGIRADGKSKFGVSLENWRGEEQTPSPGGLNVYVYSPEQRSNYGDHFFPSGTVLPDGSRPADFGPFFVRRPDVTQELGRWYCYELMVRANIPGRRDGRIAYWLDGKLVADFPNLRLRDTDTLKINSVEVSLHIRRNAVRENKKWYDDVVAATAYIGPESPGK